MVLRALQTQPLGARAVHAELARLLDAHAGAPLHLPDHVLEDIKGNVHKLAEPANYPKGTYPHDRKPTYVLFQAIIYFVHSTFSSLFRFMGPN